MKEKPLEMVIRKLRENRIRKLIPKNSALCDLGCGFHGKFLISMTEDLIYGLGVDWRVKSNKYKNITFIKSNLEQKLKAKANTFDVVTCLAVLEHLNKPENLIKEAYRILKKDGLLIITTPSKLSKPILEFLSFKLGLIGYEHIKEHKHYFDRAELRTLLKNIGFKDIQTSSFEFGMNNLAIAKK